MSTRIPAQCGRAHEHTEANTYRYGSRKECRECRQYRWRKYWRAHHESPPSAWKVVTEPEEILAAAGLPEMAVS